MHWEYNRFFPNVNGDKGEHIKAICDTFEELKVAMRQVNSLFTIDPEDVPFEDKPTARNPVLVVDLVPQCKFCGGDVYDNRGNKRTAKSPDFKCKKKNEVCGAGAWINEDGSLFWKK